MPEVARLYSSWWFWLTLLFLPLCAEFMHHRHLLGDDVFKRLFERKWRRFNPRRRKRKKHTHPK